MRKVLAGVVVLLGALSVAQAQSGPGTDANYAALRTLGLGNEAVSVRALLVLSAAALAFSTLPGRAGPCSQDIDRAWLALNAKIQARIGAGRSGPQSTTALLHRQPTPASIAAAEELAGDGWAPMEATVAALARAREADHAKDKATCEQALAQAGRAILR